MIDHPRRPKIVLFVLAGLILAVAGYATYTRGTHRAAHAGLPAISVSTAPAVLAPMPVVARALGAVNSLGQATLTATMTGEIEGPFNTTGEIAADAIVARNISPLLQDQTGAAQAQLEYAKTVLQRTLSLAQQHLRTDLDVALAQRNFAQAKSNLAALRQQASLQTMRAPFAGTLHYLVAPGSTVYRGTPVATINGRAAPWVDIRISPASSQTIQQNEDAEISGDTWRGMGHVLSIGQNAQPWGLVQVRIQLPAGNPLLPGEWVNVLLTRNGAPAVAVPQAALVMRGANAMVFVIGKHHAHEVPVQILAEAQRHVWVTGALHAGEMAAVSGTTRLKNGSPIVTQIMPGGH